MYQDMLNQAMKVFFDEEWPCEARHPRSGERCIIMRTRHDTKGHQLANGRVWGGAYTAEQDANPEPVFVDGVYDIFVKLYQALMERRRTRGLSGAVEEKQVAFQNHLRLIIQELCPFFREEEQLLSYHVCLCCLFEVPVHSLLCGHIICDQCFAASGILVREHVLGLNSCPICFKTWDQGRTHVEILRKPAPTGLRILTLDGYGD